MCISNSVWSFKKPFGRVSLLCQMANQLACVLPAVHQTFGMVRMATNTICIANLAFTARNDVP